MMERLEVSLFNLQHTLPNNLLSLWKTWMQSLYTHQHCNHSSINHMLVTPGNHIFDFANVVYGIHCQNALKHNILEKLAEISDTDLIITHTIRHSKLLPLPLHFNADNHNITDLNVCILKGNFKDTKHKKLTDLRIIINFETNKFGLNKDISLLSRYDSFKR